MDVDGQARHNQIKKHITIQEKLVSHNHHFMMCTEIPLSLPSWIRSVDWSNEMGQGSIEVGGIRDKLGSLINAVRDDWILCQVEGGHSDHRGWHSDHRGCTVIIEVGNSDHRGWHSDHRGWHSDHRGWHSDHQGWHHRPHLCQD